MSGHFACLACLTASCVPSSTLEITTILKLASMFWMIQSWELSCFCLSQGIPESQIVKHAYRSFRPGDLVRRGFFTGHCFFTLEADPLQLRDP